MTRALDIFRVLAAADKKQADFYTSLTDDERKEFQPFLVTRWLTGTSDAAQVMLLNEYANPYMFSLTKHKQLLWQLLTIADSGKQRRYTWLKQPSKLETGRSNAVKVLREYYGYSVEEAASALNILTRAQVVELAEEMGWQADEIAKVKRELKAGDDEPKRGKKKTAADDIMEF